MLRTFSIFILLLIFISCKNKKEEVNKIKRAETPTETATNVYLIYNDSSKLKAELFAPVMIRYLSDTNPMIEMPKTVLMKFYGTDGKVNAELRSNYAIRYTNKSLTKLTGNVNVINLDNDTFKTEELFWRQDTRKVYTNKFTTVKKKGEIILADGFESDQTFTNYKFYKVKAIIQVKE